MYQVRDNVKKFGINKLVNSGIYKAAFPLHDVSQMAKMIIDENESFVGQDMAEKAKEKIDKENEKEGGEDNVKKEKKVRRRKTTA